MGFIAKAREARKIANRNALISICLILATIGEFYIFVISLFAGQYLIALFAYGFSLFSMACAAHCVYETIYDYRKPEDWE